MSLEVSDSGITATRAGKSLAIKALPIQEEVLHTIKIWRLFVLLAQRHDSKSKQSVLFFLNKRLRETDYSVEGQLSALLDAITVKYNFIVGTGLFKLDGSKVVPCKTNIRTAMKNGDLIRMHQSDFNNFRLPSTNWNRSYGEPRIDGDAFVSQLSRAVSVIAPLVNYNSYVLTLDGIQDNKMQFLNFAFLPDKFFSWDRDSDPMLQVAAHFLESKRDKKVCETFCSDPSEVEKLMHQHDELIRDTFGSVARLTECCDVMANQSMHICAFKDLSSKLRIVKEVASDRSVRFFWKVLRLLLVPDSLTPSPPSASAELPATEAVGPIFHTTSMLLTSPSASPQAPHLDYSDAELRYGHGRNKEMCLPWGMDFALARGGFRLNVWDGEIFEDKYLLSAKGGDQKHPHIPETNHAILLGIPQKTFFLMSGDVVHGGALDNSIGNGALRLHWYLSPGAISDKEAIAHGKWANSRVYSDTTRTKADGGRNDIAKSLSCYLVDSEGNAWSQE
jgi:hypothetical protein